jgi:predicted ATPase
MATAARSSAPYVFVSYASIDRAAVVPVVAAIERAGMHVWLDQADIPGGSAYGAVIAEGIRHCLALIVMCTPTALVSRNVKQEIMLAWKYQRTYLPVRLETVIFPPDLEYWLEGAQWIDVFDHPEHVWLPNIMRSLDQIAQSTDDRSAPPTLVGTARKVLLPTPLTELLGRESEVQEIVRLLSTHRLVTLFGPGGIGKTRLAIAAAFASGDVFSDGTVFVDLAPVTDEEQVVATISSALGLREQPGRSLFESLAAGIGERHVLLVLDNFEQVVVAATVVAKLLASCPQLTVLVTSRVLIQVRGERAFAVQSLPVPDGNRDLSLDALSDNVAVRLFVERAQDSRADFVLSPDNVAAIADICRRLDGLPLAIELAAARIRVLNPESIRDRLGQSLKLLVAGGDGSPPRQRTLRDTIAWSHDLLTPAEQELFRWLAVFKGGFSFEAAEAVYGTDGWRELDTLDGIASLVDKSLLLRLPESAGEPRFGMLETIREFSVEQLEASDDATSARQRHAAWCITFAERAAGSGGQKRFGSPRDVLFLEAEYPNLRSALMWFTQIGDGPATLRLATALGGLWSLRGHLDDGRQWLEQALAMDDGSQPKVRASALTWLAMTVATHGDAERARECLDESLALARANNDTFGIASALVCQGFAVLHADRDHELAATLGEESERLFASVGVDWGVWMSRGLLARAAEERGNTIQAAAFYEQWLDEYWKHGGDEYGAAHSLHSLGTIVLAEGNARRAASLFTESLVLFSDLGDLGKVAWSLEWVAASGGQEHPDIGARLLSAASTLRAAIDTPLPPAEHPAYDHALASIRAALGEPEFSVAWQSGASLSVAAALTEALAFALPGHVA